MAGTENEIDYELEMAREAGPLAVAQLLAERERAKEAEAPQEPEPQAEPRAEPAPDWWSTEAGKITRVRFATWGMTVGVRELTGDDTALPPPDFELAGVGRSGPSSPSGAMLQYAEVDVWIGKHATRRLKRLMRYIYVDGIRERTLGYAYTLTDGSRIYRAEGEPEPGRYVAREPRIVRELRYDLHRFNAPEIELICQMWSIDFVAFLEARHLKLAKRFARDHGYDQANILNKKNAVSRATK